MAEAKVVAPVAVPEVAPVVVAPEVVASPVMDAMSAAIVAESDARGEGLVPMVKEGQVSFVHHMTVAAHEAVGWVKSVFKHV